MLLSEHSRECWNQNAAELRLYVVRMLESEEDKSPLSECLAEVIIVV